MRIVLLPVPADQIGAWQVTVVQILAGGTRKPAEETMNILEAYDLTGSLRNAAELVGSSDHTVARHVAEREQGLAVPRRGSSRPARVAGPFLEKLEEMVDRSQGRSVPVWRTSGWRAGHGWRLAASADRWG
jgi:transposase